MSVETMTSDHPAAKAKRGIHWSVLCALLLLGSVSVGLFVDLPLAQHGTFSRLPGEFRKLISLSEVFAHGLGVAVILIAVLVLVPTRRRQVPRVAACAFLSGIVASGLKLVVARARPYRLQESWPETVWGTFQGFLPGINENQATDAVGHAIQSFPSGHTATAVGLAIGLTWMFPKGKWLFASLALLAAIQRIEVRAHFLSDTLMGASVAFFFAGMLIRDTRLGRWFTRFENRSVSKPMDGVSDRPLNKKVA